MNKFYMIMLLTMTGCQKEKPCRDAIYRFTISCPDGMYLEPIPFVKDRFVCRCPKS